MSLMYFIIFGILLEIAFHDPPRQSHAFGVSFAPPPKNEGLVMPLCTTTSRDRVGVRGKNLQEIFGSF
jgi:hypothetical protein